MPALNLVGRRVEVCDKLAREIVGHLMLPYLKIPFDSRFMWLRSLLETVYDKGAEDKGEYPNMTQHEAEQWDRSQRCTGIRTDAEKCPIHKRGGEQPHIPITPVTEPCPLCGAQVLHCHLGEYCSSPHCRYVV